MRYLKLSVSYSHDVCLLLLFFTFFFFFRKLLESSCKCSRGHTCSDLSQLPPTTFISHKAKNSSCLIYVKSVQTVKVTNVEHTMIYYSLSFFSGWYLLIDTYCLLIGHSTIVAGDRTSRSSQPQVTGTQRTDIV